MKTKWFYDRPCKTSERIIPKFDPGIMGICFSLKIFLGAHVYFLYFFHKHIMFWEETICFTKEKNKENPIRSRTW